MQRNRRPGRFFPGFSRDIVPYLIILLPFGYYLEVIDKPLRPIIHPDAFAYIWEGPPTIWYFLGRSLSLRLLYSLAGNAPETIIRLQLFIFLLAALALYWCLRYRHWWANLLLATGLAYLFSSYSLNVVAVVVAAEAWAIALNLGFAALLFGPPWRWRTSLTLGIGVALIFSRNLGPFTMLMMLTCHYAMGWRQHRRQAPWVGLVLLAVSLGSIVLTQQFDRTVHVNTINNLYARVFPSADHTRLFMERYGMPSGPFIEDCRGNITVACVDSQQMLRVDHERQSYALRDDPYGLSDWVREHGARAYRRFLLVDRLDWTLAEFQNEFTIFSWFGLAYLWEYFPQLPPELDPLTLLTRTGMGTEQGFLGHDPLLVLRPLMRELGFFRVLPLLGLGLLGTVLVLWNRRAARLSLALALLGSGAGQFFLGYFGDGMEMTRHVYPATVLLTLGGVLYLPALAEALLGLEYPLIPRHRCRLIHHLRK